MPLTVTEGVEASADVLLAPDLSGRGLKSAWLSVSTQPGATPTTRPASFVLFANLKLPVKTVAELVAFAKANPDKVNYSSSDNGGLPHRAGEMFNAAAGTKLMHIPYKSSAPNIDDLVGGQVPLSFEALAIGLPQVQAGQLKALATTGTQRPQYRNFPAGGGRRGWFRDAVQTGSAAQMRSSSISVEPSTKPATRAPIRWRAKGCCSRRPSAPIACASAGSCRSAMRVASSLACAAASWVAGAAFWPASISRAASATIKRQAASSLAASARRQRQPW